MSKKTIVCLVLLSILIHSSYGQSVIGFWEIVNVKVGDQIMTPVAKWTEIKEDGTYTMGNGWIQNAEGSYFFDQNTQMLKPSDFYGPKDEFGAFKVTFNEENMLWEREEEGMKVKVSLQKANKKPKAPADWIVGLWDLESAIKNDEDITKEYDPNDKHYFFIRWDRIYVERNSESERKTGYWHMNGHRPELTLLSHQEGESPVRWTVDVKNETLVLNGNSDGNKELKLEFKRIREFPN